MALTTTTNAASARLENVSKFYGEFQALRDVSLVIPPGKVTCLIGPSGSGKSTLLRCINFLEEYDRGGIWIDDRLIGYDAVGGRRMAPGRLREMRRDIGMVFQQFNLWPHMTVLGNVTEALQQVRKQSKAQARERALAMLDKVGLAHKADAYPIQLSGGQQQRVAIARALALDPKILLFDEPTSALDPELVNEVLDVIRELAKSGTTLIIVTHEMGFARDVADTVVFMDQGQIVEQNTPREFFNNPQSDRTKLFLSQILGH